MKTKGDPLAMPARRTTPLSQTWPQLLQPLGFTRRTIIWDAPLRKGSGGKRNMQYELRNRHSLCYSYSRNYPSQRYSFQWSVHDDRSSGN